MLISSNISRLRQKLKDWHLVPEGLSPRQRRLAWILGGVCLVLVGYVAVIHPLLSLHRSWTAELNKQRLLLAKYQKLQGGQGEATQTNEALKAYLEEMEGRFLAGASAPVAASELQEIFKNLAGSYGLHVSSTKVLPPREAGLYLEVPLQVQLTINTGQLLTLIHHLENHRKLLFVTELEIIAPRGAAGAQEAPFFQTRLTVSGVIKAAPPQRRPTI